MKQSENLLELIIGSLIEGVCLDGGNLKASRPMSWMNGPCCEVDGVSVFPELDLSILAISVYPEFIF